MALVVPFVVAGPVAAAWWRYHNARPPLLDAGVAVGADGVARGLGPHAGPDALVPGTRVLRASGDAGAGLAAGERAWLAAGSVPGGGTPWGDTVRDALLDLRALTRLGPGTGTGADDRPGAVVASLQPSWRYVWPRDAAFVAAAFAATGHGDDAATVLGFLQSVQGADGTFQARYRPDGSGPPDARGVQLDGTGWALWATAEVADRLTPARRTALLERLRPLVERSTDAAVRLTAGGLPPVSRDYWELPVDRPTLGTAAPLAAGLAAAGPLLAELGDDGRRAAVAAAGHRLDAAMLDAFGTGWPRYPGGGSRDAAVAFLLPPFAATADPGALAAFRAAGDELRQPAGGIAPGGAGWRDDGVAWTPETAVFALAAAVTGDRHRASALLTWLARHRTAVGALPEKVRSDGRPAGPAPLAWTAAAVVLAAAELGPTGAL